MPFLVDLAFVIDGLIGTGPVLENSDLPRSDSLTSESTALVLVVSDLPMSEVPSINSFGSLTEAVLERVNGAV